MEQRRQKDRNRAVHIGEPKALASLLLGGALAHTSLGIMAATPLLVLLAFPLSDAVDVE